ncbi:MAG: hypothetical protein EZS28_031342 [Streblomastix strix]|uniref:Uncharacterized protein n=1 Tax=Streblomastix strix TaxID=222440 RepID=A0A5J4UT53_9EUKA|nr:MAG: hypothetical protein EZS28_031342 [Streblomastix strix]
MIEKSAAQIKLALKKLISQVYVNIIRGDGETVSNSIIEWLIMLFKQQEMDLDKIYQELLLQVMHALMYACASNYVAAEGSEVEK